MATEYGNVPGGAASARGCVSGCGCGAGGGCVIGCSLAVAAKRVCHMYHAPAETVETTSNSRTHVSQPRNRLGGGCVSSSANGRATSAPLGPRSAFNSG